MNTILLLTLLTQTDPKWNQISDSDGVTLSSRPVEGSKFVELKVTSFTTKSAAALCDVAFGEGKFDAEEPDLTSRTVLFQGADERVTHDQISPPMVAKRDYVVRAKRLRRADGSCAMTFESTTDLAPPVPEGWVRITKLKGSWAFEPTPDGKTKVTYVVHSDPGGSIPPFLAEGSRRTMALKWMKMIVNRAK